MLARSQTKSVMSLTPLLTADSQVATTAYADKDVVGDHLTLSDAVRDTKGTGVIQSVTIKSKVATTNIAWDVFFFNEAPANAYGDNNSGYALNDADLAKCIGCCSIATTDASVAASTNVTWTKIWGKPVQAIVGSKDLYMIVVARGAITFAAAGDLLVDVDILQD